MTERYSVRQPIGYSKKVWVYIHPIQLFAKFLLIWLRNCLIFDWLCVSDLCTGVLWNMYKFVMKQYSPMWLCTRMVYLQVCDGGNIELNVRIFIYKWIWSH